MSKPIYTHDAKINDQVVTWMARIESEKIDPSSMASLGAAEYMRLYCEQCITDGDVIAELARQCPDPKKFRLEITVVDRENSSLEFTVDEPSSTYDNALATFKDAVDHLDGLGWIGIEPTFEWVRRNSPIPCTCNLVDMDGRSYDGDCPLHENDDDEPTSQVENSAKLQSLFDDLFPILAGWEFPTEARKLPESVTFTREDLSMITDEFRRMENKHVEELAEKERECREKLHEKNQELDSLECSHEVERAMLRESFSYLLDIASDPRNPTDTEEQVAMSLARNAAHGEKLDFENLENLAQQNGLDLCTLIVEGIKRG
jgi:hypothetical protein